MPQDNIATDLDAGRKPSELTLRLISAAIGLPVLVLTLYVGFWAVSVVAMVAGALIGLESRNLAFPEIGSLRRKIAVAATGFVVVGIAVFAAVADELFDVSPIEDRTAVAIVFVIGVLLLEMTAMVRFRGAGAMKRNLALSYGAAVLLAVAMLPLIVSMEKGAQVLALGIFTVFAADTGAYFTGKSIGKHKIAPNVSPGKTWEGLLGGYVAAVLATWALSAVLSIPFGMVEVVGIGLGITTLGFLGDLSESWIKRLAGFKDSGSVIPGHGGILDRLDALAPNFVFIYFVARWLT